MDCPKFIVFIVGKGNEGEIVTRLETRGYVALVDSVNGGSRGFFKQIVGKWRGYYFEKETLVVDELGDEELAPFDFCIVFGQHTREKEEIDQWVNYFINPYTENLGSEEKALMGESFLDKPLKLKVGHGDSGLLARNLPTWYDLKMKKTSQGMLYEVVKPYTDLPYVTLNLNFTENGHLDFFTSLFICTSWGICSDDVMFLKQCWNNLEMNGEFDLDKMLKERIDRCKKGEPEPRVWRAFLEHVENLLIEKIPKRKKVGQGGVVKRINIV